MKTKTALKYFGGVKAVLAREAGVKPQAVTQWGELVPEGRAARLHILTDGKLKYDPLEYAIGIRKHGQDTPHERA
jgi:hypothetical protein